MRNNNPFEKEIKVAVLNKLIASNLITHDTIIINELVLDSFSRRADLVVINKNLLTAFEIKSEADSLARLAGQVEKYLHYFDKVIVVTTSKHIEKINDKIPKHVGLWEYENNSLIKKNRGKIKTISDKAYYLDFLKSHELKKFAKKIGLNLQHKNKNKVKNEIVNSLGKVSINDTKSFIIEMLKNRYKMPSDFFVSNILLKNEVNSCDFELLKPYSQKKHLIEPLISIENNGGNEDPLLEKLAKESSLPIFGVVPSTIKKLV